MPESGGAYWRTDQALFAEIPGGEALIAWFGFVPNFHDATPGSLSIAKGAAGLTLECFRITDEVGPDGFSRPPTASRRLRRTEVRPTMDAGMAAPAEP